MSRPRAGPQPGRKTRAVPRFARLESAGTLYWRAPLRFIAAVQVFTPAQSGLEFVFGAYVMLPESEPFVTVADTRASMVNAHEPLDSDRVPVSVISTSDPETDPVRCAVPHQRPRNTAPAPPTSAETLSVFWVTVNGTFIVTAPWVQPCSGHVEGPLVTVRLYVPCTLAGGDPSVPQPDRNERAPTNGRHAASFTGRRTLLVSCRPSKGRRRAPACVSRERRSTPHP